MYTCQHFQATMRVAKLENYLLTSFIKGPANSLTILSLIIRTILEVHIAY